MVDSEGENQLGERDWLRHVRRQVRVKGPREDLIIKEMETGIIYICTDEDNPTCATGMAGAGEFDELMKCMEVAGFKIEEETE